MGGNFSLDSTSESDTDNGSSSSSRIITLGSLAEWNSQLETNKNSNKLMVVDFTASWCIFCKIIAPAVKEFAKNYTNVVFVKIDMTSPQNDFMDVASGFDVRGYPTFVMMKNGEVVDKVVGANKEELKKKIEKNKG